MPRSAMAALLALAVAGALGWAVTTGRIALPGRGPEAAAAQAMRRELLSRLGHDRAFGYMASTQSDAWSTGEGMAGLAALGDPNDRALVGHLAEFVLSRGVMRTAESGAQTFGGYPVGTGDTLGAGEPTGYATCGIALARCRYGLGLDPEARRLEKFLLAQQNQDGSFSSVFTLGDSAARASATQDCMLGILACEAGEPKPTPEGVAAVVKAAKYMGETFDKKVGGWLPRQRRAWGGGKVIPGCSEANAWHLLEYRDYLHDAGAALPTVADDALLAYAGAFEPQPNPLDFAPADDVEDYTFDVPAGEKTSWGFAGHRWAWIVWRVLAVERIAAMPGNARPDEWRAEADRLRNRLRDLPEVLSKAPTYHVAEALLMLSLLTDTQPGDPSRGSLWRRLRAQRAQAADAPK